MEALRSFVRIGDVDPDRDDLFGFKRALGVPAWAQGVAIPVLFVATVLLTHREHVEHGTVFGFPGPAFNVLFAPIYEELIFRGWILARLVRRHSNLVAIVVSSLLFGLLHLRNIYWLEPEVLVRSMLFTGLVAGPFWAWVTLKCRSLWPAVIMHYLNNLAYYL